MGGSSSLCLGTHWTSISERTGYLYLMRVKWPVSKQILNNVRRLSLNCGCEPSNKSDTVTQRQQKFDRNKEDGTVRASRSYINYTLLPFSRDVLASSFSMNDLFAFRIVACTHTRLMLFASCVSYCVRKWGKGSRYHRYLSTIKANWPISTLISRQQQCIRFQGLWGGIKKEKNEKTGIDGNGEKRAICEKGERKRVWRGKYER